MNRRIAIFLAAAATLAGAHLAKAGPITVNPGSLTANGDVKAVFAYQDAADDDQLLKVSVAGVIFNNHSDIVGTTKDIGSNSGLIQFELDDLSVPASFINDIADSGPGGDGYFHAKYGTSAADFGVTFTQATLDAIAALSSPVILIGFEDRRNGDYDYNDLIFAFSATQVTPVPEPATIALLGAGLIGAGVMRHRRRRRA